MYKIIYAVILILMLPNAAVYAEQKTTPVLKKSSSTDHFLIGYQYSGLMGKGSADNSFDMGSGFILELSVYDKAIEKQGFAVAFGTNAYWAKNRVGKSEASTHYYTPFYLDFRKFSLESRAIRPFLSWGTGWGRLHFNKTKGSDNQWLISFGGGVHIPFGKNGDIIQAVFKPYLVIGNDVKQTYGIETHIAYGFNL